MTMTSYITPPHLPDFVGPNVIRRADRNALPLAGGTPRYSAMMRTTCGETEPALAAAHVPGRRTRFFTPSTVGTHTFERSVRGSAAGTVSSQRQTMTP